MQVGQRLPPTPPQESGYLWVLTEGEEEEEEEEVSRFIDKSSGTSRPFFKFLFRCQCTWTKSLMHTPLRSRCEGASVQSLHRTTPDIIVFRVIPILRSCRWTGFQCREEYFEAADPQTGSLYNLRNPPTPKDHNHPQT